MTVIRQQSESFECSNDHVIPFIAKVLNGGQSRYSYVNTVIDGTGKVLTQIKPIWWPLLLSTRLEIQIEGDNTRSRVTVATRSQRFIFGDAFNFYRTYIQDLMNSLKKEIEKSTEQGNTPKAFGAGNP